MEEIAAQEVGGLHPWQGELCQFFTRERVARYCLQQLSLPANVLEMKLLEPAAGHGAFVLPLVPRLVSACRAQNRSFNALRKVIRAYEVDPQVVVVLRDNCRRALQKAGVPNAKAKEIARYWVKNEDFLATRIHSRFTHIVSNPPYIRWDSIPVEQRAIYRERFPSFKQRADLYVAFIERSLELLEKDGHLGFLCPGSWTRNGYGGSIRQMLTSKGWLKTIADFSDVDSFEKAADAYPCFFVFQSNQTGPTKIFCISDGPRLSRAGGVVVERQFSKSSSPLLLSRETGVEEVINYAVSKFPTLEEAGCAVRVGSATGCNSVFLGTRKSLGVEKSRLLQFVNARSIRDSRVEWDNTEIVNVFDKEGAPVELKKFPKLKVYLEKNRKALQGRAKASKSKCWWRTIDTLHPDWYRSPKLLIVDISAQPVIGLDSNGHCAGSGVYQVKSNEWPLRELLALLSAGVLGLFVAGLSAGTNTGFHRFQKRQICALRIPKWGDLEERWRLRFQAGVSKGDLREMLQAVADLYKCEVSLLRRFLARDWKSLADLSGS